MSGNAGAEAPAHSSRYNGLSVIHDRHHRPLSNLRLSVTDRCNLRCSYCMPEQDYVWLPREDILHFEEIETLVDVFIGLGVSKVRLTGGEPLLRRGLPDLITRLAITASHPRSGHDDERRAAGAARDRVADGRAASVDGQSRHAATRRAFASSPATTRSTG